MLLPQKGLEFLWVGVRGLCKTKKIEEMYEAQIGISRGVGGLIKIPSMGEVWISSGTIQKWERVGT